MRTVPLLEYKSVTLNASGNGTIQLGPVRHANVWHPSSVAVQTNATSLDTNFTPGAVCSIYAGPIAGLSTFVDSTFDVNGAPTNANGAISSVIAGQVIYCGQFVFAVWAGATPGAIAMVYVFGTQDVGA